jgi:hypothetical protein
LTVSHTGQMAGFDIGYAYEPLACAYAFSGRLKEAREYYQLALNAYDTMRDAEDKSIFQGDMEGNWFGLF